MKNDLQNHELNLFGETCKSCLFRWYIRPWCVCISHKIQNRYLLNKVHCYLHTVLHLFREHGICNQTKNTLKISCWLKFEEMKCWKTSVMWSTIDLQQWYGEEMKAKRIKLSVFKRIWRSLITSLKRILIHIVLTEL